MQHLTVQLTDQRKGLLAAGALICVQCLIAISFKMSQTERRTYTFSQASSLTLTEAIKFLISFALYYREQRLLPDADVNHDGEQGTALLETDESDMEMGEGLRLGGSRRPKSIIPMLYSAAAEVGSKTGTGFGLLAILYAINNHTAFFMFRLADPGTIQLVKASSTIISATTMLWFLSRSIRELQWHALVVQALGLGITQMGNVNLRYTPSTYAILLGMTTVSSVAGVINDNLLKSTSASLHAQNMVLYTFGVFINLFVFIVKRWLYPETVPAFFQGYGSVGAIALIVLNSSLGIIITAVYKYADAIVKGIAGTITTAILIIISAAFFGAHLTFVPALGCAIVFLSSFTYLKAGLKPRSAAAQNPPRRVKLGISAVSCLIFLIVATCLKYGIQEPESAAPST